MNETSLSRKPTPETRLEAAKKLLITEITNNLIVNNPFEYFRNDTKNGYRPIIDDLGFVILFI